MRKMPGISFARRLWFVFIFRTATGSVVHLTLMLRRTHTRKRQHRTCTHTHTHTRRTMLLYGYILYTHVFIYTRGRRSDTGLTWTKRSPRQRDVENGLLENTCSRPAPRQLSPIAREFFPFFFFFFTGRYRTSVASGRGGLCVSRARRLAVNAPYPRARNVVRCWLCAIASTAGSSFSRENATPPVSKELCLLYASEFR